MNGTLNKWIWIGAVVFGATTARAVDSEGLDFFERRIRPTFEAHCAKCHSSKAEKVKGGLVLDDRDLILKGGASGPAVVPGDPEASRLIQAVRRVDEDLAMPPKETLSAAQIADLEAWVKMGAPAPTGSHAAKPADLWSLRPLAEPAVPAVKRADWSSQPLDRFVLSRLEQANLAPAGDADPATWLRRVQFVLTGLPPSRAEVEAFLADQSAEAREQVVDRLLTSPAFGEKWARHWLDLARYADSNGTDLNSLYDNAWRYRDYVVKAFNEDKPYPEFVREQLAGDLLPVASIEDQHEKWIATGFLMLGQKNPVDPNREKVLLDVVDEQIDVVSKTFLGLTVSCARCHDHKFDPIPTQDYYAMAGIFRSTQTLPEAGGPGLAGRNVFWNERPLGNAEETRVAEEYNKKLTQLNEDAQLARQMAQQLPGGIDSKLLDGIVLDNEEAEVAGPWQRSYYSTNFVDKNYLHDGNERAGKGKKSVRFKPEIPQGGLYEIRFAYTARFDRATNVPVRVESPAGARTIYLNQRVEPRHDKAFESLGVFDLAEGTNTVVEISNEGTRGFVVVDAIQLLPKDPQLAAKLKRAGAQPTVARTERQMMIRAVDQQRLEYDLMDLRTQAPPPLPMAMAAGEGRGMDIPVYYRGEIDRPGPVTPRGFLRSVSFAGKAEPPRVGQGDSSGRLELAEWIAHPGNPLTARVVVNRLWQHVFGQGLVRTPDNFGSMGEPPSHPELLDYLAARFIRDGWSIKGALREMALSRSFAMSSHVGGPGVEADPDNRLLWRMNRRHLPAELYRDAVLAANGSLELEKGGPSLGRVDATGGPLQGRNDSARDLGSRRRSLYLPVLRGGVNELYQVLDFADPSMTMGRRYSTTAPTQALFLMNSPFILAEAGRWAERLAAEAADGASRVHGAYLAAFGRSPNQSEVKAALDFIQAADSDAPGAGSASQGLRLFCLSLLQSTEFRFLN